jgi:hypothetical protein
MNANDKRLGGVISGLGATPHQIFAQPLFRKCVKAPTSPSRNALVHGDARETFLYCAQVGSWGWPFNLSHFFVCGPINEETVIFRHLFENGSS